MLPLHPISISVLRETLRKVVLRKRDRDRDRGKNTNRHKSRERQRHTDREKERKRLYKGSCSSCLFGGREKMVEKMFSVLASKGISEVTL